MYGILTQTLNSPFMCFIIFSTLLNLEIVLSRLVLLSTRGGKGYGRMISELCEHYVHINVNGNNIPIHEELLLFMSENKRLSVTFM